MNIDIAGVLTIPTVQDSAMAYTREFLTGLHEPVGIGAQLQLQTNQLATAPRTSDDPSQ
jgi:hypothetical protein